MRYKYYVDIHKYLRQYLAQLEGSIAKTDFANSEHTEKLKEDFSNFMKLLEEHAAYEDKAYHPMIREKDDLLFQRMEAEHKILEEKLVALGGMLDAVVEPELEEEKRHIHGYQFYLSYTDYMSAYFVHLLQEERVVMPVLQQHYSDEELRAVPFNTYDKMLPDHIIQMIEFIFPYTNLQGKQQFLRDIKDSYPQKFAQIWPKIWKMLNKTEQKCFLKNLEVEKPKE